MKQTKQFLRPLLMAIVMMVGMLMPKGAWAQSSPVTVGDEEFSTIQDAINYIVGDLVDDATLTLHQDFTLDDDESIDISFGVEDYYFNFTIDLNGHTITGSRDWNYNTIDFNNNGQGLLTVTIANSQDKKGKLVNCCLYLNQNTKVIVSDGVSLYPRFDLLNLAPQVCSIQGSTSVENYGDIYGDVVNSGGSFINNGRVAYVNDEFENNGDYCAYFNWADDGSSFSAYVNGCTYDYNEGDEETSITSEVTKEPTCTEPGVRTFTGTFIGYLDSGEQEFTDTKEVEIPAGHSYTNKTLTAEPDEHGLYAYVCDHGCGAHSDDHIVKANNASEGESTTTIELTPTIVGGTTTYTAAAPVAVPDGAFSTPVDFTATGAQVSIARTFTAATPATINLPFDVDASAMSETYYTFGGIEQNSEGKWVATMVPATGTLTANTPYIVMPTGTGISIDNTATVSFKKDASANSTTTNGYWTMTAAKAPKTWAANDPELGKAYGFAANSGTAANGEAVAAGQFVKVAAGASIAAGRAYLKYTGETSPFTRAAGAQLPASISVIFKHADATGIGTLNTETGAFTFDGWYDLQGRRISEPAKGGVIMNNNKKIIVK